MEMSGVLAGRTVLLTGGAGSGVGHGILEAVLEAGGRPVINDVDEERLSAVLKRHPEVVGVVGDVSEPEGAKRVFDRALDAVGVVHALVNNAGIGLVQRFFDVVEDAYDRLMAVDLRGVWLMTKAFSRYAIGARRPAAVVNISSVHAHSTVGGYALYAGGKGGVEALTRGMAVELGPYGVRCNAVAPGYVESEQNGMLLQSLTDDPARWARRHIEEQQALHRPVEPIDCGRAVVFLISDASRCITGQVLRVDAGTTALLYGGDFV
jgi:NAD(P)-dependent dehydrogenase (short-subunit alcohol dehydrogenase family)